MATTIQTTALTGGDAIKLVVAEPYDEVVERLRAGALVELTLQRDGSRVAVSPAHVAFVRESLA